MAVRFRRSESSDPPYPFAGRARGCRKAASAFLARTNVYVDGFNLYCGALRCTKDKWLDVARLRRSA